MVRRAAVQPRAGRATRAVALLSAIIFPLVGAAARHPMHSSLTTVAYDEPSRTARIAVRVFADDFAAAVSGRAGVTRLADAAPDSGAMARYVGSRFQLIGADGRPIPAHWCGTRREADVLWLCLWARAPLGLSGLSIRNAILLEAFDDQINVVQVTYGRRRETLLLMRGRDTRRIP